jgi:S-adenosylmethionine decarboxylase
MGEVIRPGIAAQYLIQQFESQNPSVVEMKRGILSFNGEKIPHKVECAEAVVVP